MSRVVRAATPSGVRAEILLSQHNGGSSGAFLVRADDGNRYWCKVLNNGQNSPRVPINEQIVGRLGTLIGVGVCLPVLVEIPEVLAGWEFLPGRCLEAGWAHGSLAVDPAIETRAIDHRADDDNIRRQAGFFAVHDWLAGQDAQWLIGVGEDNAYYSHDHGHYFPGGPDWTVDSLGTNVGNPYSLGAPPDGLDAQELERLAGALEAVTEEEVVSELAKLPAEWPVTDDELEAVLDFALARRGAVAERLRAMISI